MTNLNIFLPHTPFKLCSFDAHETIDAFYRGKFYLCQPKKGAHRSGLDAMLLAASVPSCFQGQLADFGSGAGAAGLAVATKCPLARVSLIENDKEMLNYAYKTCALKQNEPLKERVTIYEADITDKGKHFLEKGLKHNFFDFVIMNPPFNKQDDQKTPYPLKRKAHIMHDSMFESWIRCATTLLKAKGKISLIARPVSLPNILKAMDKRFGKIEIIPIHSYNNENAIRIIIRAKRDSHTALEIAPPVLLRQNGEKELNFESEALLNGTKDL